MTQNNNGGHAALTLTRITRALLTLGPSRILTLTLAPCFIAYGGLIGVLGSSSPLIHVLGLPVICYAALFILAGLLKLTLMLAGRAQVSHTISVAVSTFWFMVIFILSPSVTGSLSAVPWIAIALVSLFGALWPDTMRIQLYEPVVTSDTNPAMRAIDYVSRSKVRIEDHDTSERETG